MNTQVFNAPGLALMSTIVLMVPMIYFAFASLTFFLRPLGDPIVGRMLRGLFHACFLAVAVIGGLALLAFLAVGQPSVAGGLALLAASAFAIRAWSLRRMDAVLRAPGAETPRRLRRVQLTGMAYNALQIVLVLGSIPRIFPGA